MVFRFIFFRKIAHETSTKLDSQARTLKVCTVFVAGDFALVRLTTGKFLTP